MSLSITKGALPSAAGYRLQRLGDRLRHLRECKGDTVEQMALRASLPPETIVRLENGDPTITLGELGTVLWLTGRAESLDKLAEVA